MTLNFGKKRTVFVASALSVALIAGFPGAALAAQATDIDTATDDQSVALISLEYSPQYMASPFYAALQQVQRTGDYRQDIVNVALSQVGYCEGDGPDQLDGSYEGGGNYTEYGRYFKVNGLGWCSTFAMWCIREAGVPESIVSTCTAARPAHFGAPHYSWSDTVFAGGDYLPQAGDLAMFGNDGYDPEWLDHTAIVMSAELEGDMVHLKIVHGNTGEQVKVSDYMIDPATGARDDASQMLVAFVAPDYGTSGSYIGAAATTPGAKLSSVSRFDDVDANAWYVLDGSLDYVLSNGIMTGYEGSNNFGTNDHITRAQLASILFRHDTGGISIGLVPNLSDADDVEDFVWYTEPMNWALLYGLLDTYVDDYGDDVVGPNVDLSREEFATILARFAQYCGVDISTASSDAYYQMTDTDEVSDWARDALIWCTDNGIMNGSANYDGSRSIDPQRNILRCEAAKMIRVAFTQALS